jgi:hypothetical protein
LSWALEKTNHKRWFSSRIISVLKEPNKILLDTGNSEQNRIGYEPGLIGTTYGTAGENSYYPHRNSTGTPVPSGC